MSNRVTIIERLWRWLAKWFVRRSDYDLALDEYSRVVEESKAKARQLVEKYKREIAGMQNQLGTSIQIQIKINERLNFVDVLRDEFDAEDE